MEHLAGLKIEIPALSDKVAAFHAGAFPVPVVAFRCQHLGGNDNRQPYRRGNILLG